MMNKTESFDGLNCSGSAGDPSPNHFTGKQRDGETGLDYFGARYDASSLGRFMTPDWSATVEPVPYARLGDPQTLNLYTYVNDNPTTSTDPTGHVATESTGTATTPPSVDPLSNDSLLGDISQCLEGTKVGCDWLIPVVQAKTSSDKATKAAKQAQASQSTAQQQMNAAAMKAETAAVKLTRESIRNGNPAEYGGDIIKVNGAGGPGDRLDSDFRCFAEARGRSSAFDSNSA